MFDENPFMFDDIKGFLLLLSLSEFQKNQFI